MSALSACPFIKAVALSDCIAVLLAHDLQLQMCSLQANISAKQLSANKIVVTSSTAIVNHTQTLTMLTECFCLIAISLTAGVLH